MTTRRMRRTREVTTSGEEEDSSSLSSGYDLYRIQGNTKAAWRAFRKNAKEEQEEDDRNKTILEYNLLLLGYLNDSQHNSDSLLKQLDELETLLSRSDSSPETIQKQHHYVVVYNRALVHFASGDAEQTIHSTNGVVREIIQNKVKPEDNHIPILAHIAFLLLEALLATAMGRHYGFQHEMYDCPHPDKILGWLDTLDIDEQDAPIKFMLTLYKGRVDLAHLDETGKHMDSKVRSARKELKTAMEVYQHKLRQCFGADTASVVSSANSEGNSSTNFHLSSSSGHDYQQHQRPSSTILQKYGQSALNLKAHLEQLKGNTKKALILCSEAQVSAKEDESYDAIHENNHAVLYGTNGKCHLALHAMSKALRATKDPKDIATLPIFHNDGTVCRDNTPEILHNTAICALQAKKYLSAYECMVACITRSYHFRSRPRCWLRIAEACIGIFSELNEQHQRTAPSFTSVVEQGEPTGIIMDKSILHCTMEVKSEDLVASIGSAADIEQVKRNPLLRAKFILEITIVWSQTKTTTDREVLIAAQLSLAYVLLAFKDYSEALKLTDKVLAEENREPGPVGLYRKRQLATARMYAGEALLNLSRAKESIKVLAENAEDESLGPLAVDLAGVTADQAATNEKAKVQLAKAEAMVRSSCSAAYAAFGDIETAKQLANSAAAWEDAHGVKHNQSDARNALIYALLREGQSTALNLMTSLR
ncbi:CCR4-NOT transcription complex subunit 10 [Fistulifera solaris]|uniref:CCR4-NOT transcription complex subunit 10 n=1 Tax=Fistulifera solaris TaxID=1519565 RepID=A0A1Z5K7L7_FISSO|nr:CCR4-NOT transcription complex subunit 10 [Fistulifera solaris]|eukprot:GAX22260.1 CCR4-NOT transcription complex subunit 10 [Fistulifera solaris]